MMTALSQCISDMRLISEGGAWTLDAQVRAYDLLDAMLAAECLPDFLGTSEDAREYVQVYREAGNVLESRFDPDGLTREASDRLLPLERACSDARFEAAAAAGLHEFAKETFEVWQNSGVFARRRALKALRERAGFNLESHRIGNYVAKTFDLMNEAEARFARAQQAVFSNDFRYKCKKNPFMAIHAFLEDNLS